MNSERLAAAEKYEREYKAQILPQERPLFHVAPAVGWMNDPNGFSFFKGEYHLFYQYNPYDINWGPMHWGHVKSEDLIRWEHLPVFMAPDQEYDGQGCFSGSAVETPDGRHLIIYTGVQGKNETPQCRQTQCIVCGDGVQYEKYEKNPVILSDHLPEGYSTVDFRDPKIWWDKEDQCYYVVAGNRTEDGDGMVLLFSSKDGFEWNFVSRLDHSENQYGKMWECPDLFELNGKSLILISAQFMKGRGMEFHNGNEVICLVGDYDRKNHSFTRENVIAVDYGLDFYAPQTMEAPDGRRILVAWMQAWENSHLHPLGAKWAGMLTIPRELSFADGRLIQKPVRELQNYRKNQVLYRGVKLEGRQELSGINGRTIDMIVEADCSGNEKEEWSGASSIFTVSLAENAEYKTTITFDPKENTVCIDRTDSGFLYNIVSKRKALVRNRNGKIKLQIIMDRFSVEVFINDGEQVMSACLYTPQEADGISFESDGSAQINVEKYEIVL